MRFKLKTILQLIFFNVVFIVVMHSLLAMLTYKQTSSIDPQKSPTVEKGGLNEKLNDKDTNVFSKESTSLILNKQDFLKYNLSDSKVNPAKWKKAQTFVEHVNSTNWTDVSEDSQPIELNDVFISVKTTAKYHKERINILLETWWSLAQENTYFFTDENDPELNKRTNGHVVNTNCTSSHTRMSLCCKMSVEYDHFILSKKRWWCHADDDTYLNIPALEKLLQQYNHTQHWYIGRPSLNHPIKVNDFRSPSGPKLSFWFATGGAGFCVSRPLALSVMSQAGGGRLKTTCGKLRLPDDCTIGYLVKYVANSELTVIRDFHSHLETLWNIKKKEIRKIISISYVFKATSNRMNVPTLDGFPVEEDPTRFRTIHCHLFPSSQDCPESLFGKL